MWVCLLILFLIIILLYCFWKKNILESFISEPIFSKRTSILKNLNDFGPPNYLVQKNLMDTILSSNSDFWYILRFFYLKDSTALSPLFKSILKDSFFEEKFSISSSNYEKVLKIIEALYQTAAIPGKKINLKTHFDSIVKAGSNRSNIKNGDILRLEDNRIFTVLETDIENNRFYMKGRDKTFYLNFANVQSEHVTMLPESVPVKYKIESPTLSGEESCALEKATSSCDKETRDRCPVKCSLSAERIYKNCTLLFTDNNDAARYSTCIQSILPDITLWAEAQGNIGYMEINEYFESSKRENYLLCYK